MIRRTSIGALLGAVAAMTIGLSGCAGPQACPAIGYLATVSVTVDGAFPEGGQLEACINGSDCATVDTEIGDGSTLQLSKKGDEWTVTFEGERAADITLRALDAAGTVTAEHSFPLEWTRVGGTEECGGPLESDPIVFSA